MYKKRILIAEQEDQVIQDLKQKLFSMDYMVVDIARTSREAVKLAAEYTPDIILIDIDISEKMDGITAIKEIQKCQDIPFVYITSHVNERVLKRAKETEPGGFVFLPLDNSRLNNAIEKAFYKFEIGKKIVESQNGKSLHINDAPYPLWGEDLSSVKKYLRDLYESGIDDYWSYFNNNPLEIEKCFLKKKIVNANIKALKLFNADNLGNFLSSLKDCIKGEIYNFFIEMICAFSTGEREYEGKNITYSLNGERKCIIIKASLASGYESSWGKVYIFINDITKYRMSNEEAILESGERYQSLFEKSTEGIYVMDLKGNFIDANKSLLDAIGYTKEELSNLNFASLVDKEQLSNARSRVKSLMKTGVMPDVIEYKIKCKDGSSIWIEARGTIIFKDNKPSVIHGVVRNISEQMKLREQLKASLMEKDILIKEIHHRVKNNMQVISSLLNLQLKNVDDYVVRNVLIDSKNRIHSMSMVHEKLYQSENYSDFEFDNYIQDLVIQLFHSYKVDNSRVRYKILNNKISLNINKAVPCALIINELISNSLKYAFPDGKEGDIEINFSRNGGDKFHLSVKDNGVGLPEGMDYRNTDSLGMQLITALTGQLKGDVELVNSGGTEFKISFPAS